MTATKMALSEELNKTTVQQDGPSINKTSVFFMFVLPPILIIVATCGNALGYLIISSSRLSRQISASIYIRLYCIVSTMVMIFGTGQGWVCQLTDSPFLWSTNDAACRIWEFLSAIIFYLPIWLKVAFVIDRLLVCRRSRHAALMCTVLASKLISTAIFCGLLATSVHALWTYELIPNEGCGIPTDRKDLHSVVWPWICVVVYSFLPLVLLLVCTICLILSRHSQIKTAHSMTPRQEELSNLKFASQEAEENTKAVKVDEKLTLPTCKSHLSLFIERTNVYGSAQNIRRVSYCMTYSEENFQNDETGNAEHRRCSIQPSLVDEPPPPPVFLTAAVCVAITCLLCSVPPTILNVYLFQVAEFLPEHSESLAHLKSLFSAFQLFPVVSHAITPFIFACTSKYTRQEFRAFFGLRATGSKGGSCFCGYLCNGSGEKEGTAV